MGAQSYSHCPIRIGLHGIQTARHLVEACFCCLLQAALELLALFQRGPDAKGELQIFCNENVSLKTCRTSFLHDEDYDFD